MVKARNRRTSRKRRRTNQYKSIARNVQYSLSRQPMRCRVPSDPPAVSRMVDCHIRIPIRAVYIPTATATVPTPGTLYSSAYYPVTIKAGVLSPIYLTAAQIKDLIQPYIPKDTSCAIEFSLRKIMVWGPLSTGTRQCETIVSVDVGDSTNSITVSDVGTLTSRPRCGITIPYEVWQCGGTQHLLSVQFDAALEAASRWKSSDISDVGFILLTIHYRVTGLPTGMS